MVREEYVLIKWKDLAWSELEDFEDIGGSDLFALFKGRRVIYIGTFKSDRIIEEIERLLEKIPEDKENIFLCAGDIEEYSSSMVGNWEKLLQDVVCALIYNLMPRYNTHCVDKYDGRKGFVIYNQECPYIKAKIKAGLR